MKRITLLFAAAISAVGVTLDTWLFNYQRAVGLILEAAHTAVAFFSDGNGTTYSVSASLPATYDAAGYGTTTNIAWTLVGKPKTFPQFGSKRNIQEWRPISGGVEKGKGQPNYGGGQSTWGDVPADGGQVILKAAETSANHYSMKITFPDGEIHYIDVLVCSWELSAASDGAPQERLCDIQLCRAPVVVAAA